MLPPQPVQRSECQRSVNHDTLVKIVDIEPNSKAMALTFRGQPTARFIRAPRFEIPFFTISSEKFEKTEQELLAYEMPVTKIIEENSVKDIQSIEDRQFLLFIEAAVQAEQLVANAGVATAYNSTNVNGAAVVTSSVVKGEGALTATTVDYTVYPVLKPDFDDVSAWTIQDVGMTIAGETSTEGWKSGTIVGLKVIRTIKTELLREGNIYCFCAPEFLGRFYVLNQTKFYIDKIANLITWQSWEDIAIGIGNVAAIVKLVLYPASCTPGATTNATTVLAVLPVDENDALLAPVNNKVDAGYKYPNVSQF